MNDRGCLVGQRKAMMQIMDALRPSQLFKDIHGQKRRTDPLVVAWRLASIYRVRGRKNRPRDRRSGFLRLSAELLRRRKQVGRALRARDSIAPWNSDLHSVEF